MKFLVINGPNINLLGSREPNIYGNITYPQMVERIREFCSQQGIQTEFYQSNHEGHLVDSIQSAIGIYDGIIINPAAYTHTSIAILDALKAVGLPAAEVHISDISQREDFRQVSYAGMACCCHVIGKGIEGYNLAAVQLKQYIEKERTNK